MSEEAQHIAFVRSESSSSRMTPWVTDLEGTLDATGHEDEATTVEHCAGIGRGNGTDEGIDKTRDKSGCRTIIQGGFELGDVNLQERSN